MYLTVSLPDCLCPIATHHLIVTAQLSLFLTVTALLTPSHCHCLTLFQVNVLELEQRKLQTELTSVKDELQAREERVRELEEESKVYISGASDQLGGVEASLAELRDEHKVALLRLLEQKKLADTANNELTVQLQEKTEKVEELSKAYWGKEEEMQAAMTEMAREASRMKGELDGELSDVREEWRTEVDAMKEERTGLKVELASTKGKMDGLQVSMVQLGHNAKDSKEVMEAKVSEYEALSQIEIISVRSELDRLTVQKQQEQAHYETELISLSDKLEESLSMIQTLQEAGSAPAEEEYDSMVHLIENRFAESFEDSNSQLVLMEASISDLRQAHDAELRHFVIELQQSSEIIEELKTTGVQKEEELQASILNLVSKAADAKENLYAELDGLKEERSSLQIESASVKGKMEGMTTLIEQLQKERVEKEEETARLQGRGEDLQSRVSELEEELKAHLFGADQSKTMEAQFNRLQQEVADKVDESKTKMAAKEEELEGAMAEMAREASRMMGELDGELFDVREQWRSEVDGLKEERSSLQIELASVHGKMEGVVTLSEELQKERSAQEEELERLRAKEEDLQAHCAGLEGDMTLYMNGTKEQIDSMALMITGLEADHQSELDRATEERKTLISEGVDLRRKLLESAEMIELAQKESSLMGSELQSCILFQNETEQMNQFVENVRLESNMKEEELQLSLFTLAQEAAETRNKLCAELLDIREQWHAEVVSLKEELSSLQVESASKDGNADGLNRVIEGLQKELATQHEELEKLNVRDAEQRLRAEEMEAEMMVYMEASKGQLSEMEGSIEELQQMHAAELDKVLSEQQASAAEVTVTSVLLRLLSLSLSLSLS